MNSLALKYILLRYAIACAVITLAGLVINPTGIFLIIPVAIVSVKFLLYDVIVKGLKAAFPSFRVTPWFLTGYCLTVIGDMFFTYHANTEMTDAGFAFFGTFMLTPWILATALVVMAIATLVQHKK